MAPPPSIGARPVFVRVESVQPGLGRVGADRLAPIDVRDVCRPRGSTSSIPPVRTADGAHPDGLSQVRGEFGVDAVDLGDRVANSGADGLAGPFRLVAEPPVAPSETGGRSELVDQGVAFRAQRLGAVRAPGGGSIIDLFVEDVQAGFERRLRSAVQHRVGSGGPVRAPDQREDVDALAASADQCREVTESLRVRELRLAAGEEISLMPSTRRSSFVVGRSRGGVRGPARTGAPAGRAEPSCIAWALRMLGGGGGVAEGGGARAEVVVDGGVEYDAQPPTTTWVPAWGRSWS